MHDVEESELGIQHLEDDFVILFVAGELAASDAFKKNLPNSYPVPALPPIYAGATRSVSYHTRLTHLTSPPHSTSPFLPYFLRRFFPGIPTGIRLARQIAPRHSH